MNMLCVEYTFLKKQRADPRCDAVIPLCVSRHAVPFRVLLFNFVCCPDTNVTRSSGSPDTALEADKLVLADPADLAVVVRHDIVSILLVVCDQEVEAVGNLGDDVTVTIYRNCLERYSPGRNVCHDPVPGIGIGAGISAGDF